MKRLYSTVEGLIEEALKENEEDLEFGKIQPISDDYRWSTNGIYFFCASMGGGKTYHAIQHILLTERMRSRATKGVPYDQIIWTSTSGKLDQTVEAIKPKVNSEIICIEDTDLLGYLTKLFRDKMKYYALSKFINSALKKRNEVMDQIIKKHHLVNPRDHKLNLNKFISYVQSKLKKYPFTQYPSYTLLVLDDFQGHDLLRKDNSPLNKLLTKTRHYHLTCMVLTQTWRGINLDLKRRCTDIMIFAGFSEEDFQKMLTQVPCKENWKAVWEQYKRLPNKHSNVRLYLTAGEISFETCE